MLERLRLAGACRGCGRSKRPSCAAAVARAARRRATRCTTRSPGCPNRVAAARPRRRRARPPAPRQLARRAAVRRPRPAEGRSTRRSAMRAGDELLRAHRPAPARGAAPGRHRRPLLPATASASCARGSPTRPTPPGSPRASSRAFDAAVRARRPPALRQRQRRRRGRRARATTPDVLIANAEAAMYRAKRARPRPAASCTTPRSAPASPRGLRMEHDLRGALAGRRAVGRLPADPPRRRAASPRVEALARWTHPGSG